jgi:hypothetical protein
MREKLGFSIIQIAIQIRKIVRKIITCFTMNEINSNPSLYWCGRMKKKCNA